MLCFKEVMHKLAESALLDIPLHQVHGIAVSVIQQIHEPDFAYLSD
jgi:hypothetical protein